MFGLYPSDDDSLNVTITYILTNFLKDITNLLLNDIVPNRRWYSNLQHVPPWVLSISFATTLSTNLLLTFLTIATSASNFLECANRSLTSVVSLAICDPKLAAVFKISCTRSGCWVFWEQPPVSFSHIYLHVTMITVKKYLQDRLTNFFLHKTNYAKNMTTLINCKTSYELVFLTHRKVFSKLIVFSQDKKNSSSFGSSLVLWIALCF